MMERKIPIFPILFFFKNDIRPKKKLSKEIQMITIMYNLLKALKSFVKVESTDTSEIKST